ncbi:hypothetical protein D3C73_1361530 [compost metagenome]
MSQLVQGIAYPTIARVMGKDLATRITNEIADVYPCQVICRQDTHCQPKLGEHAVNLRWRGALYQ